MWDGSELVMFLVLFLAYLQALFDIHQLYKSGTTAESLMSDAHYVSHECIFQVSFSFVLHVVILLTSDPVTFPIDFIFQLNNGTC